MVGSWDEEICTWDWAAGRLTDAKGLEQRAASCMSGILETDSKVPSLSLIMCCIRTRSQGTSATNWGLMGGVKEVACFSLDSIFKRLFLARYLERREDLCILVDILHMTIRNRNHSGYCK